MEAAAAAAPVEVVELTDRELVQSIIAGEKHLFEPLMRRYNQRLFRVTRAILRDDAEAEDVTQEAWVRAYQHLAEFEWRSSFATWLTRIAVHEALRRAQKHGRYQEIDAMEESTQERQNELSSPAASPEENAGITETRALLEYSIDALPDSYREIFVLREVEQMSTAETAQSLGLSEENVKTRLHRARAMLRKELFARAGATSSAAFQFQGARCDRLVCNVMNRIEALRALVGIH